jgi:hypothetical protein
MNALRIIHGTSIEKIIEYSILNVEYSIFNILISLMRLSNL